MGETAPCIGCQLRSYTTSWRTLLLPLRHCHPIDAITQSTKGYSSILSSKLLQDGGKHGTGKVHRHGPVGTLLLLWISSLLRSEYVRNAMTMNKIFCKFTNGVFCRSIAGRGSKSISRVRIYSSKNKMLPLPSWKCSSVTILPSSSWLITWGRVSHCRLCTGLCCWQIEHSAVAVARLVLVSRHLCCCDHVYPWFLLPWPFCSWAIGQWQE